MKVFLFPSDDDGGICSWNPWSRCTATCDHSYQLRTKVCECPKPKGFGDSCVGVNRVEHRDCKVPRCDGESALRIEVSSLGFGIKRR